MCRIEAAQKVDTDRGRFPRLTLCRTAEDDGMPVFDREPVSHQDLIEISAVTQQLGRRTELRQQIADIGSRLNNQDIAAAAIIGIIASIPSTPYDNQVAQWFESTTNIPLPEYRGAASAGKAVLPILNAIQSGLAIDFAKIANAGGDQQPPMLASLFATAAQRGAIQAESVAEQLAKLVDFEDVLGLGLGKVLTKTYTKHYGLKSETIRYHEFMALAHGVQAVVSACWNVNPFVLGLALWHLGKSLYLGNVNVKQYVQLTGVALEEGRLALAGWEKSLSDSRYVDELVGRTLSQQFPTISASADSSGFGD